MDRGRLTTSPAACIACADGVPLVNVMADRQDLPDLWMHQYGGEPGTISPCTADAASLNEALRDA